MKKKFAFNLAPVKVHATPDVMSQPTTPQLFPGKDSDYCMDSPFIHRRPLTPRTEHELRAACALILQNFKPSDHGLADIDPKLDFHAMQRRREDRGRSDQVTVRQPTGAPTATARREEAVRRRQAEAAARSVDGVPARANTGRRRADHGGAADLERQHSKTLKPSSSDASRSAQVRADIESDDAKSLGTPLTGSTDAHLNGGSTAPTSAAVTSGSSSKRESNQRIEKAVPDATAQIAQPTRPGILKRPQQTPSQTQPPDDRTPQAPPPSRGKSFTSDIKGYIFPRSASLSRRQSHESINTVNSRSSSQKDTTRTESSQGWRSWNWGVQRKSSSRSTSRPGSSKGRAADEDQAKKNEVDLNRKLPPLPSLDSWKEQEQAKEKETSISKATGAHIATVMRSQDALHPDAAGPSRAAAAHRRSGSDTLALKYASSSHFHSASHSVRTGSQKKKTQGTSTAPQHPRHIVDTSLDFDTMMSAMNSSKLHDEHHQSRSGSKLSMDASRLEAAAPNFSRKISADIIRERDRNEEYQNVMKITPVGQSWSTSAKEENKSKLKKVFSSWVLRKEKKENTGQGNWMDQFEKNGIKGGVMSQEEAALPPVVRY